MKVRWWPQERTFVLMWSDRIIVGLTGLTRPSVQWRVALWWKRQRLSREGGVPGGR